jgi:UPF0716 protein FxsA
VLLIILFVGIPALELMLLLQIGGVIGGLPTLGLIVATGIIGGALARWQGLAVMRRIREDSAAGRLPAGPVIDGAMILVAGALLITPGVITDAVGFLLLIPQVRALARAQLRRRFETALRSGRVISVGARSSATIGQVIDVDAHDDRRSET